CKLAVRAPERRSAVKPATTRTRCLAQRLRLRLLGRHPNDPASNEVLRRRTSMSTSTTAIDEAKLEQFMGQMVGHMTGATACLSIWLGDELGLYRTLARGGARSVEDLAADSGCNPRLVRE